MADEKDEKDTGKKLTTRQGHPVPDWHFFLVHDDYGTRVGKALGMTAKDVATLGPLPGQVLTTEDQQRLGHLGNNGDQIDPNAWGTWTSSVHNYQAKADEVLNGLEGVKIEAPPKPQIHEQAV